jgi:hypothetical protein
LADFVCHFSEGVIKSLRLVKVVHRDIEGRGMVREKVWSVGKSRNNVNKRSMCMSQNNKWSGKGSEKWRIFG